MKTGAPDFQWYQRQRKTNIQNKTVMVQKKIKLAFEMGLPINETQFSKTTITKNDTFFSHKLMLILVNINGNQHKHKQNANMNTIYNRHAVCSFCRL